MKQTFQLVAFLFLYVTAWSQTTVIRINSGSNSLNFSGEVWSGDQYFSAGSVYGSGTAVTNTTKSQLYQTERYGNLNYSIPVPNGNYTVKLHFAEIYFSASNQRLFNVNVENNQGSLTNYDIFQKAGAKNKAIIEEFGSVNVTDGNMTISLQTVKDNAKISGIEVISNPPNAPPTIASPIPDQQTTINTASLPVNLTGVFADDKGAANLSYSITGNSNTTLITSTTINGTNLNLSIAAGQTGLSTVKVKATDAQGLFIEDEFLVTVINPNTAPVINNVIPDQTVNINTPSLIIDISGVFGDDQGAANLTLSVSGNSNTSLISNAAISGNSLTLSFVPGQSGLSTIKIKATDAGGLFTEDEFIVTVNGAPSVTIPIPDQRINFNTGTHSINLGSVFSDDGGSGNLTLSISGNTNTALVSGTSFNSNSLILTIAAAQTGTSLIKIKATDAQGLFVEDEFAVTINTAPTIANPIADQNVNVNTATIGISTTDVFTDDLGAANLTLSVTGNTNPGLVSNTSFSNGTLTLTLAPGQSGTAIIKIKATDGDGLFIEDEFSVNVNGAPAVSTPFPDRIVNINKDTVNLNLVNVFSDDQPFGNLTFSVSGNSNPGLITGHTFNSTSLTLNIAPGLTGTAQIKVKATDVNGLFVEDEFQVLVNASPVLINPVADQQVNVNTASVNLDLSSVFSDDLGASNLAISVNENSNTTLITGVTVSGQNISFTIAPGQTGASTIKVRATDGQGLFAEDEFVIQVIIPNAAPIISNPVADQLVNINTASLEINLGAVFSDDAGAANITLSVSGNSDPLLISGASLNNNTLTLSFAPAMSGNSKIKIKATDSEGLFTEEEFLVTVNGAPVVNTPVPDQLININVLSGNIDLSSTFSDDLGSQNLVLSIIGNSNPALVTNASFSGSVLTLTIAAGQTGSALIKVKATDALGLFTEDEFQVTINNAPAISIPVADQQVNMNTPTVSLDLSSVFADDQGTQHLVISVSGNTNTSLVTATAISGSTLNLTLSPGLSGISTIKVKATDQAGLFVEDEFILTVNGAPSIINAIADQLVNINTASLDINLANVFTDDAGAQNITLSVDGNSNPTLITNTSISNNILTLTFAAAQSGIASVKIKGTDAGGLFIQDEFTVTVNAAPVVLIPIPDRRVNINKDTAEINLSAVFGDDLGAAALQFSISGNSNPALINGSSFDGSKLILNFAPGQTGTASIRVKATDAGGLFAEDEFTITMNSGPSVLNPVADQVANVNTANIVVNITSLFTDDLGAANLSLSISGNSNPVLITGATISGNQLTLTVASGQSGTSTIKIKATDAGGLFAEDEFLVTINGSPTIIIPIADQQANINTASVNVNLSNIFTDDQGAASLTLSVSGNSNTALISGATTSNNMLVLTIVAGQTGSSTIKVKATDAGGLFVEEEFVIAVIIPNAAPVISNSIPDQTVNINTASVSIPLLSVFSDDNGFAGLTFSITGNSNAILISGTSFSNNNLILNIAPAQSGTATIKVKATDAGGLFVEDEFQIRVNAAPTVSTAIADQQVNINTPTLNVNLIPVFNDDMGTSNLILTVSGNSNTALINNSSINSGLLTLTITNGQTGSSIIKVKATDAQGLFTEDEFVVTVVNPNTPPAIVAPLSDQVVNINSSPLAINIGNVFSDDKGFNNLVLSVSGNTNTSLVTAATINGSTLTLNFASGVTGTSFIKLKATDAQGAFAEDEFKVDVINNTPSTVVRINSGGGAYSFNGESWSSDQHFSGGQTYSVGSAIANTTNDQLYQSERYNNVTYNIPVPNGSYTVKLHFAEIYHNSAGQRTFNVNVENSQGSLPAYDIFVKAGGKNVAIIEQFNNITVSDGAMTISLQTIIDNAKISGIEVISNTTTVNTPPVVASAITDQSVIINTPSLVINLANVFTDNNGAANLTLNVSGNSNSSLVTGASISGNNLNLTIAAGQTGSSIIKVKATDAQGLFTEDEFIVNVTNGTPAIASPIPDQQAVTNTPDKVINLSGVFTDDNGVANLVLSVSGNTNTTLISSATISNGNLTLTIAAGQKGSSTIKVKATDPYGLFIEDEFIITVQDPNAAPAVNNPIPDQSVNINASPLAISIGNVFTDDNGAANLVYSISGNTNNTLVTGAAINGNTLTLTFGTNQTGSANIKVKATDAGGLFAEDEFKVDVINNNPAVTIRINAGGGAQNFSGETWSADQYYSGGSSYSNGNSIANTTKDALYQSERYGNVTYNIPVPSGSYTVKLHFAEIYHSSVNQRKFNVNIENGQGSLSSYDIIAQAGSNNTAVIEQFSPVSVTDGTLNISLTTVTDNAKISGIEVISIGSVSNLPPVAAAGNDQSITLPTNSVSLNGSNSYDPDGTISNWAWSKISGPSGFTINNPNSAGTSISGLSEGNYVFRLTVTDNSGASSFDDVSVTVNAAPGNSTTYTVFPFNSSWKYLDNGTNQGTTWKETSFNDGSWSSGNGQLGYGDGDESTVVGFGPNSSSKYITTYFRKSVSISNPSSYANFTLNVKRDDGIVVYINGTEVYRNNMPAGTISFTTQASAAASDDGATTQTATIGTSSFINGTNLIAVEIHQADGQSADISFDMELIANGTGSSQNAQLTRGPYLQMGNTSAVSLRWRTDVPTDSKISVGTSQGNYTMSATNSSITTEHEVRITGLNPDTKYFYSFGSSSQVLQNSSTNYFRTSPLSNTNRKMSFAVFGDCGRNENGFQSTTLSAYQNFVGNNPAELLLLLGDNAYNEGTDQEYTNNFFNIYSGNILKNHVVFPTPGNHDYYSSNQSSRSGAYYESFSMPANGESGGLASGTEAWYSYNWGNVHFLSLDSYGHEDGWMRLYDTTGPQVTWLKNDLAAHSQMWTVVYFHHPPYSMGSHNSDTEYELYKIRENFIRILERYGVDLVLTGHSHDYERSYLLKGHFGNENSFSINDHAVSSSSGKYNGTNNSCPYILAPGKVNHGTVYVVAGSSGADGGVQNGYPHNAMPFSIDDGGMFYFEVQNNRLDAKFLRRDGVIADQFTIMKDAGKNSSINITNGQSTTLTASWIGNYNWSNGATSRSITVSPSSTTSYTVTDGSGCITDNFTVNVGSNTRSINTASVVEEQVTEKDEKAWSIYPVPVKRGNDLIITGEKGKIYTVDVVTKEGKTIRQLNTQGTYRLQTGNLPAGIYYIRMLSDNHQSVKRIMVVD